MSICSPLKNICNVIALTGVFKRISKCQITVNPSKIKEAESVPSTNMNPLYSFRPWSHVVGEVSFWYVKSKKVPLLPSSKFLQDGLAEAGMWPKTFVCQPTWSFSIFAKVWLEFKIPPPPHTDSVGSVSSEKRVCVCHSPIKNFSFHLLFPTAIVTVDTCTNVNVVYDKCTNVNVDNDKITLCITYVPLKIYRGLVQTKFFFVWCLEKYMYFLSIFKTNNFLPSARRMKY